MTWILEPFVHRKELTMAPLLTRYLLRNINNLTAISEWWDGYSALVDFSSPAATEWFHQGLAALQSLGVDGRMRQSPSLSLMCTSGVLAAWSPELTAVCTTDSRRAQVQLSLSWMVNMLILGAKRCDAWKVCKLDCMQSSITWHDQQCAGSKICFVSQIVESEVIC